MFRQIDKLRQFSGPLGLPHLDMPNLRGRMRDEEVQSESDQEFDFGTAEEADDGYGGGSKERAQTRDNRKRGR